ncbi:hypothetical protein [Aureibacter tunicatorum]|uniref:Uncharacterized protein n=1 Tax=Aureibacter tunicatorum TaxID=866807 RepID=A0AAE3XK89_9BACT|nr:hypothetical protein [Aureibacter tunicatorum]MDR6237539.1 hypothetical protein [Aureibacter tunicatorum]BDD02573.1 hypothetical protein AUTU_00560 [Aureibacter tunicatorum]
MKRNIYKLGLIALTVFGGLSFQSCEEVPVYEQEYTSVVVLNDHESTVVSEIDVNSDENQVFTTTVKLLKEEYTNLDKDVNVELVIDSTSTIIENGIVSIEPSNFTIGPNSQSVEVKVTVSPEAYRGSYSNQTLIKLKSDSEDLSPMIGGWTFKPGIINSSEWVGPFETLVWNHGGENVGNEEAFDWSYYARLEEHNDPDKMIIKNFWNAEGDGGSDILIRFEGKTSGYVIVSDDSDEEFQNVVSHWWDPNPMVVVNDTIGTFKIEGNDKIIDIAYHLESTFPDGYVWTSDEIIRMKKLDLSSLEGIIHHDWVASGNSFANDEENTWTYMDLWSGDLSWGGTGTTFDLWRNSVKNGQNYDAHILYVYDQSVIGVVDAGQPTLTLLEEGVEIGPDSEWVKPESGGQDHYPIVSTPSLTDSHGKTVYLGVKINNIYDPSYVHYGWIRCEISADGMTVTYLDAAFNQKPETSILAGQKSN